MDHKHALYVPTLWFSWLFTWLWSCACLMVLQFWALQCDIRSHSEQQPSTWNWKNNDEVIYSTDGITKVIPSNLGRPEFLFLVNTVGSVGDSVVDSETYIKQIQLAECTNLQRLIFDTDLTVLVGQMSQHALSTQEVTFLQQMYHTILPGYNLLHVSRLCCRFSRCKLGNKLVSSQLAKSDRSSYICANWLNSSSHDACRPGYVRYFLKHTPTVEKDNKEMVSIQTYLAFVEWYKPHPERIFKDQYHCCILTQNLYVLLLLCLLIE